MTDTAKLYKDEAGTWRWVRKAENGEIVAASTEGYVNKQEAVDNYDRVASGAIHIDIDKPDLTVFKNVQFIRPPELEEEPTE